MKIYVLLFVFIVFSNLSFSQKRQKKVEKVESDEFITIDKIALQIPDSVTNSTDSIAKYMSNHFSNTTDKVRGIYIWICSNIEYDYENMYAINFYEKKEDKIINVLKTKKGICENYASLFCDICTKAGIKSFMVHGYTKQNGFIDYIPHVWASALIDSTWYLFDPTWGSGYIFKNNFIRKINNKYYKVNPETLIKTHMPFDYLWQFLNYPITNQEFYEGKFNKDVNNKEYFNFKDSILNYENQGYIEQLISSSIRIEKNGLKNSMLFDRLQHLKIEIENEKIKQINLLFTGAIIDYNEAVDNYNTFIEYRNKLFTPLKPDSKIQNMLDVVEFKLKQANSKFDLIQTQDINTINMIKHNKKAINDLSSKLLEQQVWLKKYFSKNKNNRRMMFYEVR